MARNVWIDLGSHEGELTRRFMASPMWRPDFECHAFEANPYLERAFRHYPSSVRVHRQAAWVEDGTIEFFVNPLRPRSDGGSAARDKRTGRLDTTRPVIVPCCDFSRWIGTTFEPGDNIIVKSNIEGAEYPVFAKLLLDQTINHISRLYFRSHWRKLEIGRTVHQRLVNQLKQVEGLELLSRYDF